MAKSEENLSVSNLRSVRELILDEHKIVTYVSLSKDLGVHVNEAKILLHKVVEEIKESKLNSNLNVSYIISGLSSDKSAQTIVCSESDLEAKKYAFVTNFFHHIYSVCVGSQCVDNAVLASVNKFEDFPLCAGLIKSDTCIKRSLDEIGVLKSYNQPTADEPKYIKKETSKSLQNGHKDSKLKNNVVKISETKSEPTIKTEVISPKKDEASSMNGKHSAKNGKPNKGITGFFTRSNTAPTKLTKPVQETLKVAVKIETQTEVKDKEEIMDVDEEDEVVHIKKEPISTKKVTKNKTTLNQIKKNAKVDKKRKRVLHVSDSESEGENDPFADEQIADHDSDDEIPPTPSTNTVKITSGILNPKKRRKIVDKTYTDEEGYILTRKEEVYESCSEDETTNNVKKEPIEIQSKKENIKQKSIKQKTDVSPKDKAKTTKKVTPPQKGKQGNIMNFFKNI